MYSTGRKRYPLSRIQPLSRAEGAPARLAQGSRERPPQAGGPHPSRCGLRRTAPPSPRGRLCAPHRAQGSPRRHCATVRPDLPRCETQHYNPSVAPKARQLPLHSWLSSAASGGYSEKGKPLPSASARANSRSTSGGRRGSRGRSRTEYRVRKSAYRSYARRRRADLIRHGAGCAAPRHLPQGEGYALPRRTQICRGGNAPRFARICRGGFCIASNSIFRTQKSALAGAFVRIAYSSGKGTRAV